ncbi:amidohydrolase family protein [Daejeonella sp.]|uniref:amidohydrolase family protein n=1 Tax=Daejeonella sp. TaxID=2805397 RepID=UPI0025BC85FF|nr:amidohydrolase family protein [Daejeonella sp.]
MKTKFLYLCMIGSLFCGDAQSQMKPSKANKSSTKFYTLQDFKSVEKYDTHVHINTYDTAFINLAKADNFKLLTVNVNPSTYPSVDNQENVSLELIKSFPEQVAYATTFTVKDWGTDLWLPQTLAYLKNSFSKGAIGVKIWKNIGMELRDKDGKFVMVNDARLDPVFDFIEKNNVTLIGHLGEPKNAWLPVDQMTVSGDKSYFSKNPKYHMYLHPEYPSYQDQIDARDKMLEKHPTIRFVGVHLGSLEWDVDELAKRLDKFPNMAVDMAERICHLQYQTINNRQKVYDFMVKYQDRLIYATDNSVGKSSNPIEYKKRIHERRMSDWRYFVSDDEMNVTDFQEKIQGLKLPKEVIDKIYRTNAEKWFPGI